MHRRWLTAALLPGLALLLLAPAARSDSVLGIHRGSATDRIIVKWRDDGVAAVQIAAVGDRAARLTSATGIHLAAVHNVHDSLDVMQLDRPLSGASLQSVLARLKADPSVEYAEADAYRYVQATVNDPHFAAGSDNVGSWGGQWYLLPSSSTTPAAISATTAWDSTMGSSNIVVAVIDTGVRFDHEDLLPAASGGKLYPGYDFVSCDTGNTLNSDGTASSTNCSTSSPTYLFANDGNGWDPDPTDPGDWIDSNDLANKTFSGNSNCSTSTQPSTWHGTRVAGIIGALTNNGVGIAGAAPNTMILPVRVVGKCGAAISDLVAAMRWAAGLTVTGIATNPHPAKIINLSLGAGQACSSTEQAAITDIINAGVLVVAAAGNDGGPVNAPANCSGVLSVAGIRHTGTKVGYSSLSSSSTAISIAAPAGNCVNTGASTKPYYVSPGSPCVYSIETLSNAGNTTPVAGSFYTYALFSSNYASYTANPDNVGNVGTSFAAPLASGVAALMLGANPALSPSQLRARIESSALTFPTTSATSSTQCTLAKTTTDSNGNYTDTSQNTECICTTATCGAGMLNAYNAVQAALNADVTITTSTDSAGLGQHVTLDGSGSSAAAGATIVSYHWTSSVDGSLANADQAVATLVFPAFRSVTVTLTITDSAGTSTSASKVVLSSFASASGSGGGALGLELWALWGLAVWRLAQRRMLMQSRPLIQRHFLN